MLLMHLPPEVSDLDPASIPIALCPSDSDLLDLQPQVLRPQEPVMLYFQALS